MNLALKLQSLGLTPEVIRRHVVSIAPPFTAARDPADAAYKIAWRAKQVAAGLTVEGKPRRRLPNGQRKPRTR